MTRAQHSRIELRGFRSFGNFQQFLDLAFSVSTLWGGNSQGKTSFVETLAFLVTSQIVNRRVGVDGP
jgi:recombinational DNA repair ATPase RecF